jgi:hypothetical protein
VIDPVLGALANNGGTTQTRALMTGSPALDAGNNTLVSEAFDQRRAGFIRIRDGNGDSTIMVDIGAFEVQQAPLAAGVSVTGRVITANGRGIRNSIVSLTDSSGETRTAVTDEIQVGQTYILSVSSKRYRFTDSSRVISDMDALADADFMASP